MSFAEVLADDLNISIDSAYRRLRSDTNLTFEELQILCNKYKISLDSFLSSSAESVTFNYRAIDHKGFELKDYFRSILHNIESIRRYEARKLIYTAKDIPLPHIFRYNGLTAFKIFFWSSNIYDSTGHEEEQFIMKDLPKDMLKNAGKIWESYSNVPSVEIWSDDTINNILRQIDYCYSMGKIDSPEIALQLCQEVREIILDLRMSAESGYKNVMENRKGKDTGQEFSLFYNRIIIPDNMVYYKMGNLQMVHLGHNVLNILSSSDRHFCNHTYDVIQKLIESSVKIQAGESTEKETFFSSMLDKISLLERKINP